MPHTDSLEYHNKSIHRNHTVQEHPFASSNTSEGEINQAHVPLSVSESVSVWTTNILTINECALADFLINEDTSVHGSASSPIPNAWTDLPKGDNIRASDGVHASLKTKKQRHNRVNEDLDIIIVKWVK